MLKITTCYTLRLVKACKITIHSGFNNWTRIRKTSNKIKAWIKIDAAILCRKSNHVQNSYWQYKDCRGIECGSEKIHHVYYSHYRNELENGLKIMITVYLEMIPNQMRRDEIRFIWFHCSSSPIFILRANEMNWNGNFSPFTIRNKMDGKDEKRWIKIRTHAQYDICIMYMKVKKGISLILCLYHLNTWPLICYPLLFLYILCVCISI